MFCIYHIYTITGRFGPPLALVKLLRVLDRHPDLLDEFKVA
jgi:HTH-type transcriptional regulator/antitoxin MqsA